MRPGSRRWARGAGVPGDLGARRIHDDIPGSCRGRHGAFRNTPRGAGSGAPAGEHRLPLAAVPGGDTFSHRGDPRGGDPSRGSARGIRAAAAVTWARCGAGSGIRRLARPNCVQNGSGVRTLSVHPDGATPVASSPGHCPAVHPGDTTPRSPRTVPDPAIPSGAAPARRRCKEATLRILRRQNPSRRLPLLHGPS